MRLFILMEFNRKQKIAIDFIFVFICVEFIWVSQAISRLIHNLWSLFPRLLPVPAHFAVILLFIYKRRKEKKKRSLCYHWLLIEIFIQVSVCAVLSIYDEIFDTRITCVILQQLPFRAFILNGSSFNVVWSTFFEYIIWLFFCSSLCSAFPQNIGIFDYERSYDHVEIL